MSVRAAAVDGLLWVGVALQLLCCIAMLVARSAVDRLHFAAPATLGTLLIAFAVLLHYSFSLIGDKALLVAAIVVLTAPVATQAIARCAFLLSGRDWRSTQTTEREPG
jgi:monovalent cation/proton antiporter MnhG/PhaG subunit